MGRKLYAKGEGFNPTTGIDDVEGLREELDALKRGSGGGGGDTTAIERRLTTAEGEIDALQGDVAEQSKEIAAVSAKVNTLQGTDTDKSVRTIAAEETAKIVGDAPDNYNTLKEIADYISSDAEGAAELRNKVNKNATDIAALQSTKASKVEAQGYATTAKNEAIAAAAADAQEKANTAENNANDYTDDAVDDLAKGQVATNKANIASLEAAQTSLSATVKSNTNNIATHTQQIANLDIDKLGKTEKAADSAKADSATKLATARKIWGQSFDGTGDVNGDFKQSLITSTGNVLTTWLRTTAIDTNYGLFEILAKTVASSADKDTYYSSLIAINAKTKNVGIGTTTPSEKLDVAGNIKASGMLITGSDAHVGGKVVADGGITSSGDIDASGNNIKGNLSGTIDRVANTGNNATPIHLLGLPTEDNNTPLIDTGVTVEEGVISAEGFKTSGTVDAATLEGNLVGTIKAVMRNTNLFLLGFAQEAGAAAKPYVTTQVSVNNGVLTIKGLRVEGDVEITGNTVIGGRLTSAASYQSSPISTTSEEGVPTTEEQLRAQISTLEERIEALEQLIAQNNG